MLETGIKSIHSLFSGPVQFKIPFYQRHYVWNEEEQWEPLWQDIMRITEENVGVPISSARKKHFTGSIVVRELDLRVGAVPEHEIIDGQQRLTTFQIILCAIADVCHSAKLEDTAGQAAEYIMNGGLLNNRHNPDRLRTPLEAYKILPTETDRASFIALMDGERGKSRGNIREAYNFFRAKVLEYMRMAEDPRVQMIELIYAIIHSFEVAQILPTGDSDPERVFESVNARGKTINEFDHLRNNIFLKARVSAENAGSSTGTEAEDEVQRLYNTHWRHFEDPYWTKKLGPDDEEMLLSECFVKHFLMAKLGKSSIPHRDVFNVYEREYRASLPENQRIELEFHELERYSKVYRVMLDCEYDADSETCLKFHPTLRMELLAERMAFYKALNITSIYPLVLYIINELEITHRDMENIFDILEAYTIRRLLVINQGIQNYNEIFAAAIKYFGKNPLEPITLQKYLSGLPKEDKCPNDKNVREALSYCGGTRISGLLARYILYRIELFKAAPYDTVKGSLRFGDHLTLEHVMPIRWLEHWGVSDSRISELGKERDRAKQSIGNLTLLTQKINGRLRNLSFFDKQGPLLRHSDLEITKEIVYEDVEFLEIRESWDVAQIREREEDLSKCVCEAIWPFMSVHSGEIKNWHPKFTKGFIIDVHGEELPVEVDEFRPEDIRSLRQGTQVKFEKEPIKGGFKAVNVVRV